MSADFMEQAYLQVLARTSIPASFADQAMQEFVLAQRSGDPRRSVATAVQWFGEIDFNWFWLDEAKDLFKGLGRWPYLWRSFTEDGDDPRFTIKGRVRLLEHTIGRVAATLRRADDIKRSDEYDGRPVIHLRFSSAGCPVEDEVARLMLPRFMGAPSHLPPYFPGDRVGIMTARTEGQLKKFASDTWPWRPPGGLS